MKADRGVFKTYIGSLFHRLYTGTERKEYRQQDKVAQRGNEQDDRHEHPELGGRGERAERKERHGDAGNNRTHRAWDQAGPEHLRG